MPAIATPKIICLPKPLGFLSNTSSQWLHQSPPPSVNNRIGSTIASTRKDLKNLADKETTSSCGRMALAPTLLPTILYPNWSIGYARAPPSLAYWNKPESFLDKGGVHLGIIKSSTVFLLQIAETNSLYDISNNLEENPAESHSPKSELINDTQFLYFTLT